MRGTRHYSQWVLMLVAPTVVLLCAATTMATSGSVVGWGSRVVGVDLSSGFQAVATGELHSLGLKADGSVVAWGLNDEGQCDVPSPNEGFVAVAAGVYHSLGLKDDGSVVAWGRCDFGECDVPSPNEGFVAVAAGRFHSLGLIRPTARSWPGGTTSGASATCRRRTRGLSPWRRARGTAWA